MSKKEKEPKAKREPVFGEFWQVGGDGKLSFHHEGMLIRLRTDGFCWIRIDDKKRLVKISGKKVQEVDITDISDHLYNYIQAKVPPNIGGGYEKKDLLNLYSRGIDNFINFPKLRLLGIKEIPFHFDTKTECYFYFLNGVVKVTADKVSLIPYAELNGYVWVKQIRKHDITISNNGTTGGDFKEFCFRVCNKDEKKFESLQSIIGYILHRHFSPSLTVVPCLLEETVNGTDEAQGGTGKTTICLALGEIRNMIVIDGKDFKPGGNFRFQRLDLDTEIIFIDDLDRNTSFEFCFSIVSTGVEVNQKNKAAFRIPKEKTPGIIITSNFPVKSIAGNSTERRKLEFEVSSYYNAENKPVHEFGREFFQDWVEEDYSLMFNFFLSSTQLYLKRGIIKPPTVNYELRKVISAVGADLKEFLDFKIMEGNTKLNKKDLHEEFLKSYTSLKDFYRSPHKFTMKVHKYLDFRNIPYREIPAATKRVIEMDLSDVPTNESEGGDG